MRSLSIALQPYPLMVCQAADSHRENDAVNNEEGRASGLCFVEAAITGQARIRQDVVRT